MTKQEIRSSSILSIILSEIGFFALSDHNLSDEEIAVAYKKSQDFFT